ncbi:hypothetical protein [Vreelandella malpeensis]|uniref:Sodium-dependent phosphate transporter n=1 Tax=Vreelandella malpeensis TaxID=1172368 RepID=A0ABS8DV80_9GAMM|nr:hypothetical protein [Halomonas malpeensis]MCB8890176.1 hypothetical protein [Halomonas malpeensis]
MIDTTSHATQESYLDQGQQARQSRLRQWVTLLLLVYFLICAVAIVGDGFKLAIGDHSERLFEFATNPFVALMVGIVATALIQSSSTVISVIVALATS